MQRTLAILMAYIRGKDVDDGETDLVNFVKDPENKDWCEKLTSFLCKRFDKTHARFMCNFPFAALDVCGITIWARCYRRQVAIVFNTSFWCTSRDQDIHKCDIILVYRGSNSFEDTRVMTMEEFNTLTDNVGRIQALMDEKELSKNVSDMVRKRAKDYRKTVDRIESDDDSELDLEETLEQGIPVPKQKKRRKTRGTLDLTMTTRSRSRSMQKTPDHTELVKEPDDNMQKQSPASTTESAAANNMQKCSVVITSQDLTSALNRVRQMNEDLVKFKEDNKLTDAKEKEKPKPKRKPKTATRKSPRKSVERKIKMDKAASLLKNARTQRKGSWGAAVNKRHQVKTLLKIYICPVTPCSEKKGSKKALLKHIATEHKKFRFQCRYCEKKYQTFTGRYKHEKYHLHGKPYACQYCPKSFLFEGERDEHLCKHTRKNLWICELDNCDKGYASKRAMKAHLKSHYDEEVVCEMELENGKECGQICINSVHLSQHQRGMHGEGWVSPCGIRFNWPSTMYKHRRECDDCADILAKKKKK